jgi:hypothetical protein
MTNYLTDILTIISLTILSIKFIRARKDAGLGESSLSTETIQQTNPSVVADRIPHSNLCIVRKSYKDHPKKTNPTTKDKNQPKKTKPKIKGKAQPKRKLILQIIFFICQLGLYSNNLAIITHNIIQTYETPSLLLEAHQTLTTLSYPCKTPHNTTSELEHPPKSTHAFGLGGVGTGPGHTINPTSLNNAQPRLPHIPEAVQSSTLFSENYLKFEMTPEEELEELLHKNSTLKEQAEAAAANNQNTSMIVDTEMDCKLTYWMNGYESKSEGISNWLGLRLSNIVADNENLVRFDIVNETKDEEIDKHWRQDKLLIYCTRDIAARLAKYKSVELLYEGKKGMMYLEKVKVGDVIKYSIIEGSQGSAETIWCTPRDWDLNKAEAIIHVHAKKFFHEASIVAIKWWRVAYKMDAKRYEAGTLVKVQVYLKEEKYFKSKLNRVPFKFPGTYDLSPKFVWTSNTLPNKAVVPTAYPLFTHFFTIVPSDTDNLTTTTWLLVALANICFIFVKQIITTKQEKPQYKWKVIVSRIIRGERMIMYIRKRKEQRSSTRSLISSTTMMRSKILIALTLISQIQVVGATTNSETQHVNNNVGIIATTLAINAVSHLFNGNLNEAAAPQAPIPPLHQNMNIRIVSQNIQSLLNSDLRKERITEILLDADLKVDFLLLQETWARSKDDLQWLHHSKELRDFTIIHDADYDDDDRPRNGQGTAIIYRRIWSTYIHKKFTHKGRFTGILIQKSHTIYC